MYELVYGLHEPGDEALRAVLRMGADIFPDWPKKLAPENAAFATLLAPFASTEALEEKFGYHRTEDGTDVFMVRKDQIGSFLASVESDFVGLRYYLGEQQIMVLSDVGDIEVTVTFDGTFLSGIALHYKLSDGTKAEQKMTITDIGKTEISLPSAAKEKFESLKFDAGSEEEPSNWISWLKQYQLDAIEGRVDKDVATINALLKALWECVQDPAINAELKEMIAKEKDQELIIYYSEGSNYDKTGVASIDAKLKEKFGNAKIKMESVMWVPLSLQIYFIADGPDGSVQMYYNLD